MTQETLPALSLEDMHRMLGQRDIMIEQLQASLLKVMKQRDETLMKLAEGKEPDGPTG